MLAIILPLALALTTAFADDPCHARENIEIADLWVRMLPENDTVTGVSFLLSGRNATNLTCSATDLSLPSQIVNCRDADSKYRFSLLHGDKVNYALRIFHEIAVGCVLQLDEAVRVSRR